MLLLPAAGRSLPDAVDARLAQSAVAELSQTGTTRTLKDAFDWPHHLNARLLQLDGPTSLPRAIRTLNRTTVSTAFSGVDAPGVAAAVWQNALKS
eukprot:3024825-Alexandrium_andersonii.AAC.1